MTNGKNPQKWRFWPVILLTSFYTINSSLIMLGIPILFFQRGVSIEIIGFLSAAQIIAYCFSPLLFNKVSDKLGRKKSLIIATVGTSCTQITYYIILIPHTTCHLLQYQLQKNLWRLYPTSSNFQGIKCGSLIAVWFNLGQVKHR